MNYRKLLAAAALSVSVACAAAGAPAFAVGSPLPAAASVSPVLLVADDAQIPLADGESALLNGTRLVALREATGALKASLSWNADTLRATLARGGVRLVFDARARTVSVNGGPPAPASLTLRQGRLLVPLRLVAEKFGYRLEALSGGLGVRLLDGKASLTTAAVTAKFKSELALIKAERDRLKAQAAGRPAPAGAPKGKTVYLTFDDGPTATTPAILSLLEKYDARATFFMLGPEISAHPDTVKRMVKDGDALGVHGVTHRAELIYRTPESVIAEMDAANAALKKAAGEETRLMRVPYGSKPYMKQAYRDAVAGAHYKMWDWNVDSLDSRSGETTPGIDTETLKQLAAKNKAGVDPVIIFHDHPKTLAALPAVLDYLQACGYSFGVLSEDMRPLNFWNDVR